MESDAKRPPLNGGNALRIPKKSRWPLVLAVIAVCFVVAFPYMCKLFIWLGWYWIFGPHSGVDSAPVN
jgi:hypothetical protein